MLFLASGYEAYMIKPVQAIISVNIRILSDPQSGQLVTQIDWGTLMPGQTACMHPQYDFFYGPFKNNRRSFRLCKSNDRFSVWRWVIRA
jgi:hypothetical protein